MPNISKITTIAFKKILTDDSLSVNWFIMKTNFYCSKKVQSSPSMPFPLEAAILLLYNNKGRAPAGGRLVKQPVTSTYVSRKTKKLQTEKSMFRF